jgi:hypothetical protein
MAGWAGMKKDKCDNLFWVKTNEATLLWLVSSL